ncbi:hypothetical protein MWU52_07845 [Jannaschia sp. S6380]|uniref:hypothetical protein n=1 Tax=Jannaschia sp. S6380 TaxID=2926408 RepID=UPI001FF379B2|nr:hypothetical protein [Jannaschia sp. S6380]MCK0167455.1 hypothetical protein [Jannaschia sp. S6380]
MKTRTTQTIGDLIAIAVAIFFIVSASFDAMPARSALNTVALFVIGLSLWRIWRRRGA